MGEKGYAMEWLVFGRGSHVDHGITRKHWLWIDSLESIRSSRGYKEHVLDLPEGLSPVEDVLHLDVPEEEAFYRVRGSRKRLSRVCRRPPTPTRRVVVVLNGRQVVTAYGSRHEFSIPPAPGGSRYRKSSRQEKEAAKSFWKKAALSYKGRY